MIKTILAVITTEPAIVAGGAPIFVARTPEEQEKLALYLSKVLGGMVHDLGNGVSIVVSH
ncbi:hypothetical protein Tph_c15630 [Thermacetogenium phaeum DSM 12270]|uniref:Uncharacterized protein n=1 Tax=Thermacetogenium phaeum (strain ATCC BAA-254 / DSM 26808 / PB) TaxID=1089553 RepID=K4LG02_THEPS|nr:hypothetical protein [Thermacetogenium phaeum]AFV11768.1 hypothetical protein Tph_c15630 [Thermacetogenium phaeum DSM 12270]